MKKNKPIIEGYQIDLFTKKETPVFFNYKNCTSCNKIMSAVAYKRNKGKCNKCLEKNK